jgi:hypothetical protein
MCWCVGVLVCSDVKAKPKASRPKTPKGGKDEVEEDQADGPPPEPPDVSPMCTQTMLTGTNAHGTIRCEVCTLEIHADCAKPHLGMLLCFSKNTKTQLTQCFPQAACSSCRRCMRRSTDPAIYARCKKFACPKCIQKVLGLLYCHKCVMQMQKSQEDDQACSSTEGKIS